MAAPALLLSTLISLLGLMSASIDSRLLKTKTKQKEPHLLTRKWKAFDAEFLHDIEII